MPDTVPKYVCNYSHSNSVSQVTIDIFILQDDKAKELKTDLVSFQGHKAIMGA